MNYLLKKAHQTRWLGWLRRCIGSVNFVDSGHIFRVDVIVCLKILVHSSRESFNFLTALFIGHIQVTSWSSVARAVDLNTHPILSNT